MENCRCKKLGLMAETIIAIFIFSAIPFAISYGLNITAEFTGQGVFNDGEEKIFVRIPFSVEIYAENTADDPTRYACSMPFQFYGTGDITNLINPGVVQVTSQFLSLWQMYFIEYESWNGDLTNGSGISSNDQFCFAGIQTPGWEPGSGVIKAFIINFDGIVGDGSTVGQFCIDSGDFVNNTYDWLFEPPSPSFGPVCRSVIGWQCGDTNSDGIVNLFDIIYLIKYQYGLGPAPVPLESANVDGDLTISIFDITYLISYLYLDGPELNCP